MKVGSSGLSDNDFCQEIESGRYPASAFHHGDHLRLGWILLSKLPFESALEQAERVIRRFAEHNGAAGLYHETITQAWMRLLATRDEPDFPTFLTRNAARISPALLRSFWREETLHSAQARAQWVPPDVRPLPPLA